MAITSIRDLQIVPDKWNDYTLQRITDKLTLVRRGVATGSPLLRQLINGTPKGGRFLQMPFVKPLEGDDWVFGEGEQNNQQATGIQTGNAIASLLVRWHMWGNSDLSHVLGGIDPMGAVSSLVADWWAQKEQAIYLSIFKGLLGGPINNHVNDVSTREGLEAEIGVENTIDTKQLLGDNAYNLGMVFMHSATYSYLQKKQNIETEYDATLQVKISTYLGYEVVIDDGLPRYTYVETENTEGATLVTAENYWQIQPFCASRLRVDESYVVNAPRPVYDTYFIGRGALYREDGLPAGLTGVETDRDKVLAEDYLIHRRCMVIHPNGFSWRVPGGDGLYGSSRMYFPDNGDLADPGNWSLVTDHKNIAIACLRHCV